MSLTQEERSILLRLARQALEEGVRGKPLAPLDLSRLPLRLREPGASFVTLTREGQLRGCVGTLEAYQPLAEDVREHAVAAALNDFRFPPVTPEEVPHLRIEISCLTPPQSLEYTSPEELLTRLRPGIDGVVLRRGWRRATFLPQVWEQLPDPETFLDHLCLKMGLPAGCWREGEMEVLVYQVESFEEEE
ncbi:MAG: AmmeMemoRadiSam system protein A [Chloroflexi bacterium]|nr:AmmeMemoRadiSam system protein A [Chloroflexota bacterium]